MHLTIDLPFDVENQLRAQAQQTGKALNQYITGLIKEKIQPPHSKTTALSAEETHLFQTINKGFSTEFWSQLHNLDKKRRAEKLSEKECQELISMTEQMEIANLERLNAIIALANIRQTDIDTLMTELGISNGKHT